MCSDVYESNNASGTAKTIPTNTNIVAMIGTTTIRDWFKFRLHRQTRMFGWTSPIYHLTTIFVCITLLFHSLEFLRAGGTTSEQIIRNTTTATTYYVRVYGYNGAMSTTSCYTLRINVGSTAFRTLEDIVADAGTMPAKMISLCSRILRKMSECFTALQDESIQIRVFDMVGKTVRDEHMEVVEGFNKFNFDMTSFNKELYFVELTNFWKNCEKLILEK